MEQKKQQQEADRAARITCHVCGEPGHRQRDCPKKSKYLPRAPPPATQQHDQSTTRQQQRKGAKSQDTNRSRTTAAVEQIHTHQSQSASQSTEAVQDTSPAAESEGTSMTCPVCRELFVDPRILNCLHSVCARCLNQLVMPQTPTYLTCAVCASPTEMTEGGFVAVPQNHALATAVDAERAARRLCGIIARSQFNELMLVKRIVRRRTVQFTVMNARHLCVLHVVKVYTASVSHEVTMLLEQPRRKLWQEHVVNMKENG